MIRRQIQPPARPAAEVQFLERERQQRQTARLARGVGGDLAHQGVVDAQVDAAFRAGRKPLPQLDVRDRRLDHAFQSQTTRRGHAVVPLPIQHATQTGMRHAAVEKVGPNGRHHPEARLLDRFQQEIQKGVAPISHRRGEQLLHLIEHQQPFRGGRATRQHALDQLRKGLRIRLEPPILVAGPQPVQVGGSFSLQAADQGTQRIVAPLGGHHGRDQPLATAGDFRTAPLLQPRPQPGPDQRRFPGPRGAGHDQQALSLLRLQALDELLRLGLAAKEDGGLGVIEVIEAGIGLAIPLGFGWLHVGLAEGLFEAVEGSPQFAAGGARLPDRVQQGAAGRSAPHRISRIPIAQVHQVGRDRRGLALHDEPVIERVAREQVPQKGAAVAAVVPERLGDQQRLEVVANPGVHGSGDHRQRGPQRRLGGFQRVQNRDHAAALIAEIALAGVGLRQLGPTVMQPHHLEVLVEDRRTRGARFRAGVVLKEAVVGVGHEVVLQGDFLVETAGVLDDRDPLVLFDPDWLERQRRSELGRVSGGGSG